MRSAFLFALSAALPLAACSKAEDHDGHAQHADASASAAPAAASAKAGPSPAERRAAAAEAKGALGKIVKGVVAAAEKEPAPSDTLALGGDAAPKKLPASTEPVPASLADVKGKPYAPQAADWASWKSVGFESTDPLPCQLQWTAASDSEGKASAKCDLDGDGAVDYHAEYPVAVVSGEVKVAPTIVEVVALPRE